MDTPQLTTREISNLKDRAKKMRKEQGIAHTKALDMLAQEKGFKDWKNLFFIHKAQLQEQLGPGPADKSD